MSSLKTPHFILLTLGFLTLSLSPLLQASPKSSIEGFKELKVQNRHQIDSLQKQMSQQIDPPKERPIPSNRESILRSLSQRIQELKLRAVFYDQILFQTEKKFKGPSLPLFLPGQLKQMSKSYLFSGDENLGIFSLYLSEAIQKTFEPTENIFTFIKEYLEYSSIQKPLPPQGFSKQANYSNHFEVETVVREITPQIKLPFKEIKIPKMALDEEVEAIVRGSSKPRIDRPEGGDHGDKEGDH